MPTTTAQIKNIAGETTTVKIGDVIGFKSDVEQYGEIVEIKKLDSGDGFEFTLKANGRFSGEYIGGKTETWVYDNECWI